MAILTSCTLIVAALVVASRAQRSNDNFLVTVKTGDGEDTDTNSNVLVVFEDSNGRMTKPFPINQFGRRHLDRGGIDQHRVPIPEGFGRIVTMQVSRDNKHVISPDWFCDHVFVDDFRINNRFYFPIDRWIEGNLVYKFENYATCLPQFDPSKNTRELTLQNKRKDYEFTYHLGAAMVKNLPRDEFFDQDYHLRFIADRVSTVARALAQFPAWVTFNDINTMYRGEFALPESFNFWKEDSWFGAQRVQGIVPNIIELCNKIPDKLGVTEETVKGLLEGSTLQQALRNNQIFITDLEVLDGIEYRNNLDHASPIALFYLNRRNQLMPIAIQLRQRKGPNNPVYTPSDPFSTWLVAKMYYNNAEGQVHETLTHFGYTHTIADGIATSMHRQLSPSHPIFKLLKPHFLYLLTVNKDGEKRLFTPGAQIELWSMGFHGFKQLLPKGIQHFTFERAIGNVESDHTARGVWDKQVLPYYPFRDDAMSMYNIIRKYVTTVLINYYDTSAKVRADWELQNWRAELAKPRAQGGVGIPDLPGSRIGFGDVGEVIDLVTMIITHSSAGHSAVNFPQYDTYGYLPNYPAMIREGPPSQKREYTEAEIMKLLPNRINSLGIVATMKVLSWQGTNDLGDFEKRYLFDPVSLKAHTKLREDLKEFSKEVKNRNRNRLFPYKYLDPNYVPNAISI
ncbi:unnamed protein product, partial [Meganyctiphanes norvegica]